MRCVHDGCWLFMSCCTPLRVAHVLRSPLRWPYRSRPYPCVPFLSTLSRVPQHSSHALPSGLAHGYTALQRALHPNRACLLLTNDALHFLCSRPSDLQQRQEPLLTVLYPTLSPA